MLTGNALLAALESLPQSRLRGEFWRVVTASSLLGLEIEAGRTTVTRRFPNWLYAGGPDSERRPLYTNRWTIDPLRRLQRTSRKR
jgi:hypothetical protein